MPYVGTVVDGILNSGTVKAGDAVLFGPDSNGNFHSTVIKTIERKRYVRPPCAQGALVLVVC